MAKIPTILEAGRADGKLIKINSVYDDNQEKFLSDKIREIDDNHNTLKDEVNTLTEVVNNNKSDIETKLETEKNRAINAESSLNSKLETEKNRAVVAEDKLKETINNITKVNTNATTANIVTIDTLPNSTSSNVQQALNSLYKNSLYAGIAIPTTNPGTPDGPVFYIATTAGIYSNFGGIKVIEGEAVILQWNNNTWTKKTTGLATQNNIIYDISAHNGGIAFESLSVLLGSDNLSTIIPSAVRCGGMSIRFIQSSDNKYVQARCMAQNFTTDVTQWQEVDDEPTSISNNLVKSRGVYGNSAKLVSDLLPIIELPTLKGWLNNTNVIIDYGQSEFCVIKVKGGDVVNKPSAKNSQAMIVKSFDFNYSLPYIPNYATGETGRRDVLSNLTLPEDAEYILLSVKDLSGNNVLPSSFTINGIDIINTNWRKFFKNNKDLINNRYDIIENQRISYNISFPILDIIPSVKGHLDGSNKIVEWGLSEYKAIKINGGEKIEATGVSRGISAIAFVKTFNIFATNNYLLDLATGETGIRVITNEKRIVMAPEDAKYLIVRSKHVDGTSNELLFLSIDGISYVDSLEKNLTVNNISIDALKDKTYHGNKTLTKQCIDYLDSTKTVNGVTVTCKSNGKFSFVGTGNSNGGRIIRLSNLFYLKAGIYTLHTSQNISSGLIVCYVTPNDNIGEIGFFFTNGMTITITESKEYYFSVNVFKDAVYNYNDITIELNCEYSEEVNITAYDAVCRNSMKALIDYSLGSIINPYKIGSWWDETLESKIAQINERGQSIGSNGIGFIFFTDYHINTSNNASPSIMKKIQNKTSVSTIIYGGDTFDYQGTSAKSVAKLRDWYINIGKPLNIIPVRGNHDINPYARDDRDVIPDGSWYDIMLRPIEGRAKLHGMPYYYIDNDVQKIRFIILDWGSIPHNPWNDNGVQAVWLQNRLTELSSEWGVVIFIHCAIEQDTQDGSPYVDSRSRYAINAINAIYDSLNCTLISVIAGHVHKDINMITEKGYNIIATTSDSSGANASYDWNDPVHEKGTTNECAFDVVQIDKSNRKIYMTRIGSGNDRTFNY